MKNDTIIQNNGAQVSLNSIDTSQLSTFSKAMDQMIATNDNAYTSNWSPFRTTRKRLREYSPEEVARIIESGELVEQRDLSYNYFKKDGFYKRIIIYYATLLSYIGILIPNPSYGKQLSTDYIKKKYYNAVNFIDKLSLKSFFTNCAVSAFIYGCYYGVILKLDKNTFAVLDLPIKYCNSRFKDIYGNDIIEFDVTYFDSIIDQESRNQALSTYPDVISDYYWRFKNGEAKTRWVTIPSDIGICFPLFDETPLFLNVIPATIDYDEAVDVEQERDLEEIKKILVQHVPHLQDGSLLFEPEEAQEMHRGAVQMLKSNKNISVLTSYADVEAVVSKTAADNSTNNLEKMVNNIYFQAGASGQLFAATGNLALDSSIKNDLSLAMILAHKFETFTTNIVNRLYSNSNITFKYTILPISVYNSDKYIENAFKLASGGYSLLLPMLAMGFSQNDINNIKDLENDVLKLNEKLRPLSTAYTQTQDSNQNTEGGAPEKEIEEKAPKTIQNKESLDKGGSN